MKTFYSILSINIKPEINERLSVGMIMIFKEKIYFHYSRKKLSIIQRLVSRDIYKATLDYLKMVEKSISNNESLIQTTGNLLLKTESKYDRIFSEQYIEYLSRYNSNLVSFSKPNFIDLEATEQIFKKLFEKLIDDSAIEVVPIEKTSIEQFKKGYFPLFKSYFNIEQEIDSANFPGLITPIKIDLLGKNHNKVFGQTIDFEKRTMAIDLNIGNLLQLSRALPNAKKFILGSEPSKMIDINHNIWNNIRNLSDFEYVDISEAEKLTDYARTNGVTPLFN